MSKAVKILGSLLVLALLASAGAGVYIAGEIEAPETQPQDPFFRVEPGDSVATIAARLEERGFLRSRTLFRLYARLMQTDGNLQTGYYQISEPLSLPDLHDLLLRGEQYLVSVTIPEGYTLRRTAALLEDKGIVSAADFTAAVESEELMDELAIPAESARGFLFPDTYRFALQTPAEMVVRHMVSTFFEELESLGIVPEEYSSDELYNRVILASIVEREYRIPEEAPLIASVFYNRLDIGMALQSCATVVYVLTEEQDKPHPQFITYRDLEVASQFNTYQHPGLPPAPICNPGRVALESVFFPAQSDYLYFLVEDPEAGKHTFTRTLSDHNAAKRLYIKSN